MSLFYRRVIWIGAGVSGLLGLLGIWGWISGLWLLASFRSSFIPMAPLTAALFVLISLGLLLYTRQPGRGVTFPVFCTALVVTGTALLKLIEFTHYYHFGFEETLVRHPAAFGMVPTARMSPITAFFFFLTGLSLMSLTRQNAPRSIAGFLSATVVGFDLVVLLGYLYGTPLLYGGAVIPMALTTALAFSFLGVGLLAAAGPHALPMRWISGRTTRAVLLRTFLPVPFLTVITNAVIYHVLPLQLNAALAAALSGVLSAPVIALLVSRVAFRVGRDIDRAEEALRQAHAALAGAYDSTLEGWSRALDLRDKVTEGHCRRVAEITVLLARSMGLPEEQMIHIRRGAYLHDIGKMGLPDSVLLKPAKLNEEEWAIMRQHPAHAEKMLGKIDYLQPALEIPYCHHEHWDGSGYPRGLKAEEIPLNARIFSVVDIWDALISDRPYKKGWPEAEARAYIQSLSGTHLDPKVVEAFLKLELPRHTEHPHTGDSAAA